ncbi:unnamed protein product [Auanema sp. JU1783]|nr:unnamed protein product [Auanema sp. JU1783]
MADFDSGAAKPKTRERDHTSARSEAAQFLTDLSKPSERERTANELYRYVTVSLRNEEPQFVEEFIAFLDNKNDHAQSVIHESIYSDDLDRRKVGIYLIVCLAEINVRSQRIVWYSNFLLRAITFPKNDEATMDLAARALVFLIQTSKAHSADLVEKCLDQCLEWLQEPIVNSIRRLAAVLLARELAMFTSTSFFSRANVFFRNIFAVIRDPKHNIRLQATEALHAALTITSQREAKQKTEWYQMCIKEAFPDSNDSHSTSYDDRSHSMLLVLNELLRIADANFEKVHLEAKGTKRKAASIDDPIEWMTEARFSVTVESTTARGLVRDNFDKIVRSILGIEKSNNLHVQSVLLELLPRLSALDGCCTVEQRITFFNQMQTMWERNHLSKALMSMGLIILQQPDKFATKAKKITTKCHEMIYSGSQKKFVDAQVFTYLKLYVRAYKTAVFSEIKNILDDLLKLPLSEGLTGLLHEITSNIPTLVVDVQDGLMKVLYKTLTGQTLPAKIDPPRKPILPQNAITVEPGKDETDKVLALKTLGSFEFQRHSLQMCMQYIAEGYLLADSVPVRLAAVRCCTNILSPFIKVFTGVHREHRQWVLELIHGVLKCLVSVGVMDQKLVVRLCVFKCFVEADNQFLSHLAQPKMLELLFMSLHDEKLEMQEAAVSLIGRLSEINPALVLPRLRRVLLETLDQLSNSGQSRLEQHSARLLVQIARQNPKFMRPYLGGLFTALLPKLRLDPKHVDVTVQVLNAVSELCVVGGSEVVKCIEPLFSQLTVLVSESSSLQRREATLQCIGRMSRATAYVVDPYRDYPNLLDDILRLLKTEMSSSMRRQAIKVLGILGAIDPYTHKVFTGSVQSSTRISMALSKPSTNHDSTDPRQDIIQWFNYEKCTLEEFYPAITIANLMVMVQDKALIQHYQDIAQALLTIFRSLGDTYPQYVQQVVPRLIEVTRNCKDRPSQREFFLRQLASLVGIIKSHAKPYIPDLFGLIGEAWSETSSIKITIVSVLEQIGTALESEFSPHVAQLIPYLLQVLQADRDPERRITSQVLACIKSLSYCLTPHLQLVLPPVLSIIEESVVPLAVKKSALETVLHLIENDDVSDFAPRLMQTWFKCFELNLFKTPQLEDLLLKLLIAVIDQMWKNFEVFKRFVDHKLRKHNLINTPFHHAYMERVQAVLSSPVNQRPKRGYGTKAIADPDHPRLRKGHGNASSQLYNQTSGRQRVNIDVVSEAWAVGHLSSKEDWTQWLIKLRLAFIRSGSSAAIRAAASVSDLYPHLAKNIFNAAFMSVWTELKESEQDSVTLALSYALQHSDHPDVIQTILNLAEFMDHSERGPLPIDYQTLRRSAEETKAYAKGLRYTENEILKSRRENNLQPDDCQSLITFANKLNVHEEAAGVVRYAETRRLEIPMQGRWYEKLNEWEKALDSYDKDRTLGLKEKQRIESTKEAGYLTKLQENEKKHEEIKAHELRCLEALGDWTELNTRAAEMVGRDQKVTVIASRGAWAVGNWSEMSKYVQQVNENSQDGALLRAVLAVRNEEYSLATSYINKVRDMYDSELTAMASESYERAYGAMIQVQQLAELEEAIEYKLRPERRPRIALLWSRRLQGCSQNIEHWQRLLMLRSLVLSPQEMHPLRVKFASLCRQQGKLSMCRAVLRDLLNVSPDTPLDKATAPTDKPQLVLAFCKQLWIDNSKQNAVHTLDGLVKHIERYPPNNYTSENSRLCAKAYLKLAQWTEVLSIEDEKNKGSGGHGSEFNKVLHGSTKALGKMTIEDAPSLMSPSEMEVSRKVISCYSKATEYDQKWHKAWHKLACSHLHAMNREKELAQKYSTSITRPQDSSPSVLIPKPLSADINDIPSGVLFVDRSLSPLHAPVMQPAEIRPCLYHAKNAVRCFAKALMLAPGSRLEDTLRLLQLWFDYGEDDSVYNQLRESIKGLPVETWLEVVPQLMARLDSNQKMAVLIKQVIHEVSKTRPQALVYALTVASKSTNLNRATNAKEMLHMMGEIHSRLVDEARLVSEELVRCAILWHEQWHDALDDASRLYFQEKDFKSMMEILRPMHDMIDLGPTTLKEQSFNQTYYADLTDAFKFCLAYEKNENQKELSQAWEIYCQIFKRIAGQIRQLSSLDLNYVSPHLMRAKNLELAVPGTYDPNTPVINIASVGTHLTIISSKQRPRKMTMRGSNGLEYAFLLKGREDPRQDERVMQLFGLVNTLLVNNAETCRRNLTIERYSITALSQNSGLIGWIPNSDTLHCMIKDYREKKKDSTLSLEHKLMLIFAPDTDQLTIMQKMQVFQCALECSEGDDLRKILWLKSPSSEVWFDRRTNYTRSVACMSMVGYILGLGDRHPSNLMLDRLTGKIVHIDFGDCFDVAMTREKFPERIPFRLTRMLINAMEVTGIDGIYRFTCQQVLTLLRSNKESLLAVLEAFVYDPVINWRLLDGTKKDPGQQKEYGKKAAISQREAPRMVSEQVMEKIKHKLSARRYITDPLEVSVEQQIDELIEQATLAENLCQAYIGWCPFW